MNGFEWGKVNADLTRFNLSVFTDSEGQFSFWAPINIYMSIYMENTKQMCWKQEAHRIRTDRQGLYPISFTQSGYNFRYTVNHGMVATLNYFEDEDFKDDEGGKQSEKKVQMHYGRGEGATCLDRNGVWTLRLQPEALKVEQSTF